MKDAERALECDLCVVGAGYAALNGLNAVAKYMKPGERVVMIDKNETWGGQWLHQYDFVRLHQPYRMFTAGDQPWTLGPPGSPRDPSYLASRREVLDHLSTVPSVSAGHLQVLGLFNHAYESHRVYQGRVEIEAFPTGGSDRKPTRVRARRLLKATGVDIQRLPPFKLTSSKCRSVGISDPVLGKPEFLDDAAPVYIIGSGKTAMDCARHLIQAQKHLGGVGGANPRQRRSINIIIGSGMWFFHRDNLYPKGVYRHTRGTLTGDLFLKMTQLFDGTNEAAVMDHFARAGWLHTVFGQGGNCRYGLLSVHEKDDILAGLENIYRGHLIDVDGSRMTLRENGENREVQIQDDAWFINCTTHLRQFPHEAILQDSGLVCAPQYALGFSGTSAYFVSHLWCRGDLGKVAAELFRVRIDVEPKLRFAPQVGVMVMANMALIGAHLPFSISSKFQGDYNKWYPFHRHIPMLARVLSNKDETLKKAERVLKDRFSDSVSQ